MKFRVETANEFWTLDLPGDGAFSLTGPAEHRGTASVVETQPGIYSVLLQGGRSITVRVTHAAEGLEVLAGDMRFVLNVGDARDRPLGTKRTHATGTAEVRSQMPGKVIKLLVEPGAAVQAGEGLVVIEAMKMQNEMKSPKDGTVSRIHVMEGAAVGAGELLVAID